MDDLQKETNRHFAKLKSTLAYQKNKFNETRKPIVKAEIDALEFVMRYAEEALEQQGIRV